MTTGYILIAAILILGGTIATVGDRIGTRVGKARLSLFKLRPRKTAVVVTIVTGSIISASTLAILFAADEQLRTGVFELEEIQADLRNKRQQLKNTRQQLEAKTKETNEVERKLYQARAEQKTAQIEAQKQQAEAQKRLKAINQSLQSALARQNQTQVELNRTQAQKAQTQAELNRTQAQKTQTQAELNRTQAQKAQTQAELNRTQGQISQVISQFRTAQARLKNVSKQATVLRSEIKQLQSERQQLIEQRDQLKAQIGERDIAIAKLDENIAESDRHIAERNKIIAERDRDIVERDRVIARRETRLKELETQQDYLERQAQVLERNLQALRGGNLVISRNQVLASGVVRVVKPSAARQAIEEFLREANRNAIGFTQPGLDEVNDRVVKISQAEVNQLIAKINDGRDYVVQILSAENYVLGEKSVQVFGDATLNQVVFRQGDIVAAISANPATMTAEELRQRLELLLGASSFRAQRSGIMGDRIQIGDNSIQTLIDFIEQLKEYNQPVELKTVVAGVTYTSGPLKVELVAVNNGKVIFGTSSVIRQQAEALEPNLAPQNPTSAPK